MISILSNKIIYKGYDYNAGREIAWCEIKLNSNNPNESIEKINNQIELIKSIEQHENILKYINSWQNISKGIYIIIEELCNGGNINSNYKYIQKPKLKLIKKWIKEILTGLDYLHSNKIVHHDIKCENIYLDRITGHLKIGCIGSLEKLPSNKDYFEKYLGTPEFMAPEVNEGKYNFNADIYSLGLTLIELLTVQKPYKECEGALNIYVNKKKGILPESFNIINDKGIREFILLCLNYQNKRPTAKELLEKNKWLNDKDISQNNSIIEIKGALRQKNFYLNNRYKSGANIAIQKHNSSNKNVIKYNSKMYKNFNLISRKSFHSNYNNNSGNIHNNNTINNSNLSFSFKNNYLTVNKSTTTSRTDNLISNRTNIHNNDEDNHDIIINNKIIDDNNSNKSNINSNNISRDYTSNNNKNLNNINIINSDFSSNNNNSIINKPIIKEKINNSNILYGLNNFNSGKCIRRKFFSPEQNNSRKNVIIPHLNFGPIQNSQNNNNNYQKINSFRELNQYKIINNNSSSIRSIIIHCDENEYNNNYYEIEENNDYYINYNIVYTINCNDNKSITCEYNYEKDTVDLIIKNLKEIMSIDANDIILLKNEFGKKINGYMDKKKLRIFFNKYYLILNKFKIMGNLFKKFDKIINEKNLKNNISNNKLNAILEKIKDYQMKKNAINNINNNNCNN